MAEDELIVRADFGDKVPYVEYSLANPLGCAVLSLLDVMASRARKTYHQARQGNV